MPAELIRFLLFFLVFFLGFLIGLYIDDARGPTVGSIHIKETRESIKWIINLYPKFSPEEISRKKFVKFGIIDDRRHDE